MHSKAIDHLVEHGWISLRQMAILLGYNELRGIYQRQRGKNAIPTVRVGGIERVYTEDALKVLISSPDDEAVLTLYRRAVKLKDTQDA